MSSEQRKLYISFAPGMPGGSFTMPYLENASIGKCSTLGLRRRVARGGLVV
jgi:hypothetical protein